ncbi:MAG: ParB N-terminal domain-containing protein [Deltaproteobacteria bacterium]|nr:ParB N-terminal domain-containing protein [Deltaproteobacteria bacterium]
MGAKKTPTKKAASASPAKAAAEPTDKKAPTRGKRKPAEAGSSGLSAADVAGVDDAPVAALANAIEKDGGMVLARYRDPLFGKPVIFAVLPLEKVTRTSFQRDVSEAHVDKLVDAMKRTGAYLDPVIAVRDGDGPDPNYKSPNGGHRLAALARLGAKSVTALITPDERLAFKILALNTEKAHALKDKALEAIRMLRALAPFGGDEETFAGELEEPSLVSMGAAYDKRPKLAGGTYNALTKRADSWLPLPVKDAVAAREKRGQLILDLDDAVAPLVEALRKKFDSPGLRQVVLSRVAPAPARGVKLEGTFEEIFAAVIARARAFDIETIAISDLSAAGGAPSEE